MQGVRTLLARGADVHTTDDWALRYAAGGGHAEIVQALLAAGADVHAGSDYALWWASSNGHAETAKVLLAAGADVHAWDDGALCSAVWFDHTDTVQILAAHIFAPDSWRGKSRAEIEALANSLYDKIKTQDPEPEDLRQAGAILIDHALRCWEQVRPALPKIQISPLPAQPRPV